MEMVGGNEMKKAEKIYRDTRTMVINHIDAFGYDPDTDGGFNGMATEECVYKRTMNEMVKIHSSKVRFLKNWIK